MCEFGTLLSFLESELWELLYPNGSPTGRPRFLTCFSYWESIVKINVDDSQTSYSKSIIYSEVQIIDLLAFINSKYIRKTYF